MRDHEPSWDEATFRIGRRWDHLAAGLRKFLVGVLVATIVGWIVVADWMWRLLRGDLLRGEKP